MSKSAVIVPSIIQQYPPIIQNPAKRNRNTTAPVNSKQPFLFAPNLVCFSDHPTLEWMLLFTCLHIFSFSNRRSTRLTRNRFPVKGHRTRIRRGSEASSIRSTKKRASMWTANNDVREMEKLAWLRTFMLKFNRFLKWFLCQQRKYWISGICGQ